MTIAFRPGSVGEGLMGLKASKRFTDLRPNEERWELRDGIPVMNPAPTNFHQIIIRNLISALDRFAIAQQDRWHVFPGTNVVPDTDKPNAPIPDIAVRFGEPLHSSFIEDIVVAFEILSPESRRRDLEEKPLLYAAIASLQHYVVVDFKRVRVTLFDRASGFAPQVATDAEAQLRLDALNVVLAVKDIYRQTGLVDKRP